MLAFQQLSTEQLQQCVKYCCAWSDPPILYPAAHSGDLNLILDYLAILYYQAGNRLPLPLVSFVAHLNEMPGNPPGLKAWLERLTEWLGNAAITPQHLADVRRDKGPAASEQTPYLMIEIKPLRNSSNYHVDCYYWKNEKEHWYLRVDNEEEVGLSAVPQIVIDELNKESWPPPYLELILPKALLTDNETLRSWEQWAIDSNERSRPLGVEYPINLRCRERLREVERHKKCGCDHLAKYWGKYCACFSKPPARRCAAWLTIDKKQDYIDYVHSNDPFFGLLFSPQPSYLYDLLNAGAALLLWPRQENLSATMQELLDHYFSQHALHELPEALRRIRESVFIKSDGAQTVDLSLLWDDPNRRPELDAGRLTFAT